MAILRVIQTGQRQAFDIIEDAPDYETRHQASAVYVHFQDVVEEAPLRTYSNDPYPFGPTLRHYRNISEGIIDRFHLLEGQEFHAVFMIESDGSHHYIIQL